MCPYDTFFRVKLIFVNRYFHPDISATSQMLSGLAFHLAGKGAEVHVITSRQRYDDPAAALSSSELVRGVQVHRVPTSRFGRGNLLGRVLDYASFYLSASLKLASLATRGDIVIAKTDPPLISVPAMLVARLRGAQLVNWLQDLFPEVAERAGLRLGGIAGLARAARNLSLRKAAANVVLGERVPANRHDDSLGVAREKHGGLAGGIRAAYHHYGLVATGVCLCHGVSIITRCVKLGRSYRQLRGCILHE